MSVQVGRYWAAYRWGTEKPSKRAFERVMNVGRCGVWRSRHPLDPPHTDYVLFLMAEEEEPFRRAVDVCTGLRGTPYVPEPGLIDSLRARRATLAAQAAQTGDYKQVSRNRPRTLDRAGRMHDYPEGEGSGENAAPGRRAAP